jgi:hypothetical protein
VRSCAVSLILFGLKLTVNEERLELQGGIRLTTIFIFADYTYYSKL